MSILTKTAWCVIIPFCLSLPTLGQLNSKSEGIILYETISGVARPDVGARVYLLDIKKLPKNVHLGTVDSLLKIIFALNQVEYLNDPPADARQTIEAYKMKSRKDESFKKLDKRAFLTTQAFINNSSTIATLADGVGRYSIKAKGGPYYLLLQSRLGTSTCLTEIEGVVFITFRLLKAGETSEFNWTFREE